MPIVTIVIIWNPSHASPIRTNALTCLKKYLKTHRVKKEKKGSILQKIILNLMKNFEMANHLLFYEISDGKVAIIVLWVWYTDCKINIVLF